MISKEIQIVEFIKHSPPYVRGEQAGFAPSRAEDLKNRGLVRLIGKPFERDAKKEDAPKREVGKGRRALTAGQEYETK